MVRLRTVDFADIFGWAQYGLLDSGTSGFRLWQHRHGDQHRGNHSLHALPRHDISQNAVVRMAQPGDGRLGDSCHQSTYGCTAYAAGRSLSWRTLLRHSGGRLRRDLDAFLLDLRTSGGLWA